MGSSWPVGDSWRVRTRAKSPHGSSLAMRRRGSIVANVPVCKTPGCQDVAAGESDQTAPEPPQAVSPSLDGLGLSRGLLRHHGAGEAAVAPMLAGGPWVPTILVLSPLRSSGRWGLRVPRGGRP